MNKKEYPDYSNPLNFYNHSYIDALTLGHEDDYYHTYHYNRECKDATEQAIDKCYDDVFGKLVPGVAAAIIKVYGVERIAYILQETIKNRIEDERFSMDNRAWSVGVGAYFKDLDYADEFNHVLTTSSVALNKFINQFRKESNFDPVWDLIGTAKDPYPFVYLNSYKSASLNNELPKYLWSWGLNCKCARALDPVMADPSFSGFSEVLDQFGRERVSVVLSETLNLYKNNRDIKEENKAWAKSIDLPKTDSVKDTNNYLLHTDAKAINDFMNEYLPILKACGPGDKNQERLLFDVLPKPGFCNFGIYQIKDNDSRWLLSVEEYSPDNKSKVNPGDYKFIYEGVCRKEPVTQDDLNGLYAKFSEGHPEDFKGYPLFTSDVIVLNDGECFKAFYLDEIRFLEFSDFVEERRDMLDETLNLQEQELSCSR